MPRALTAGTVEWIACGWTVVGVARGKVTRVARRRQTIIWVATVRVVTRIARRRVVAFTFTLRIAQRWVVAFTFTLWIAQRRVVAFTFTLR
jgi:hypothetical protein